ncbi:imidazole glycerol phosphate synthase subunit HisH [Virgibacillus phasianinus]|uniref:Imidazole glycerol phosphate synthase subunit HisH n=1 Tax=Virgibacillus phasianinus TaxID=2017483 RepID=A0A220U041_9BACI|nr:imidazole glycerol phosphate synthase subunit HisH [Virgibacillus phasianinus]ASK61419.1 imidazole glycerol phosphate synthase subunit HisH [Virgibacillus phasianinus]
MIAIIDYGVGNIKSLQFAFDKLDIKTCVTASKETITSCDAVVLPGVGAFNDAMKALEAHGLVDILKHEAGSGKPFLGICLGMQLLYEKSYEDGIWDGLGLLSGQIERIAPTVKVPHMGWNTLAHHRANPIISSIDEQSYVYFVHSYYITKPDQASLVSSCLYGDEVPAIVQRDNVIGMQFHPEKSGQIGIQLLKNFGEMIS